MKIKDLITQLELLCPTEYAMDFDKTGVQIGYHLEDELRGVYICLDVTLEEIANAKKLGANFILSHHPMLFEMPVRIKEGELNSQKIIDCIHHQMSVYAMHTNYDVVRMGELAADMIGMRHLKPLMLTQPQEEKGIGMVGQLASPISLEELLVLIKLAFHLDSVAVYGLMDKTVFNIAISPGSGKNMKKYALEHQVDLFITGDITHHDGLEASEMGLTIVDAGHFGIEHIFIRDMYRQLIKMGIPTDMIHLSGQKSPFQIV